MWHSGLCRVAAVAVLMSAFGAALVQAAELPDGPGKAETTRLCAKCHTVDQAVSLRQGQAAWSQTISKMVELGAEGTDAEFTTVLNYLVKNFGSRNSGPPAPSSSTPATDTS